MDRRFFLALIGSVAASGGGTTALAADAAGAVTALTGRAVAVGSDGERALVVGAAIRDGDVVTTATASRVTLRLGRSTTVHLGPATRLKVEPHLAEAGGVLELVDGSMLYDHVRTPGNGPSNALVRSPYGLIAVRGTRFWAGQSKGRFGVFLDHGRVDVSASGHTVRLTPGLGTDMASPGDAPAAPRRWPAARVREALTETTGRPRMPSRK
jgi:ferric-dicitrate binding protein FerR (iron transport regulator)